MQLTDFHAKYMAMTLCGSGQGTGLERLIGTLSDARVDLNPHQVEAALFAFHSPFLKGAILADEVGLGKTIEAGLVIAQKWAEQKRRILIVVPASLRAQWQRELMEKFYLPAVILDGDAFQDCIKAGMPNPFEQEAVVITSYHFAHARADSVRAVSWDAAVIDEAHRLRNVYKTDNVMATALHEALGDCFKLLLTATPLQNSLLELYGLVGFIDDHIFGDLNSFKTQFSFLRGEQTHEYDDLAERMHTLCIRTLRRQVAEYIRYTERLPLTQEFIPTPKEQELYAKFSRYLQRDRLWALPNSGRHLVSLMLWKMLSSSSFALAGTLDKLILRLEAMRESGYDLTPVKMAYWDEAAADDDEEPDAPKLPKRRLTEKDRRSLSAEIDELRAYRELAAGIDHNAKGDALLLALDKAFAKLKELKAPQKAVIFTESRRTQAYLAELLQRSRYKNSVVLYHGGLNNKQKEQAKADFEAGAKILVATEAAAEGLNLQYCALVVNYDLPWNPQRIEQRIGRCHRYGQKNDVAVVNFLNQNNLADRRVYELLCEKFQLFEGVFGASDEVLGAVDGLDFESRILDIYQRCRTAAEIEKSFEELRNSLSPQIGKKIRDIPRRLLENFHVEVTERLKLNDTDSSRYLNQFDRMLWELTKHMLRNCADFDEESKSFTLVKNPYYTSRYGYKRFGGVYRMDKAAPLEERYRLKGSLAQTVIRDAFENLYRTSGEVCFDLTGHTGKISGLEPFKGRTGYLALYDLEIVYPGRRETRLLFSGCLEDGAALTQDQLRRLFDLSGETLSDHRFELPEEALKRLDTLHKEEQASLLEEAARQNSAWFDEEMDKLEKWAKDVKQSMEKGLRELDGRIAELRKQARKPMKLQEKLALQEQIAALEDKRNKQRFDLYSEQDDIDRKKEALIGETKGRLTQTVNGRQVFAIKWRVK